LHLVVGKTVHILDAPVDLRDVDFLVAAWTARMNAPSRESDCQKPHTKGTKGHHGEKKKKRLGPLANSIIPL